MGATMGKTGGNFLDALPTQGTLHVVMLGLDSAGKTTALYRLKFDQYLNTVPTIGFNCEKVQGTVGKAKGVQFLVWDVGGQEKLRPLWRSYTRCTDGILFVVDSVDVERMEEAKMELMRTAKCPDNQGVPVLILANKQDLPGARDPKELEKLLGLHELVYPSVQLSAMSSASSSSTGNIVGCSSSSGSSHSYGRSLTPTSQHNKSFGGGYGVAVSGSGGGGSGSLTKELSVQFSALSASENTISSTSLMEQQHQHNYHHQHDASSSSIGSSNVSGDGSHHHHHHHHHLHHSTKHGSSDALLDTVTPYSSVTTPTTATATATLSMKKSSSSISAAATSGTNTLQFKGWYIQPACAITGEGLQEGLEALYEMILKRRKLNKAYKKKR